VLIDCQVSLLIVIPNSRRVLARMRNLLLACTIRTADSSLRSE
jgi:hypothetical protein